MSEYWAVTNEGRWLARDGSWQPKEHRVRFTRESAYEIAGTDPNSRVVHVTVAPKHSSELPHAVVTIGGKVIARFFNRGDAKTFYGTLPTALKYWIRTDDDN